jgi:hypothetical protein
MTIADRVDAGAGFAPPGTPSLSPSPVRLCFVGYRGDYWRLMIRGGTLQAITLGIYRFWLFTDMRRFLWASTEVEGETLEYTGTAVELLIGFLMAIGILIPIYALLFVASLEFGAPAACRYRGIHGAGWLRPIRRLSGLATASPARCFAACGSIRADRGALRGAMLWWIDRVLAQACFAVGDDESRTLQDALSTAIRAALRPRLVPASAAF